ncbi:MAG: MATE family efflux transporter [Clostridia bacterium]|nr:MATE family efflux transporter [Clostridia bacterium]
MTQKYAEVTIWKRQFSRYASLNVLSMIGLACYFLVDTFFISRACGPLGLTALNLAIPAYSLMHGVGLMLGMGGATKYRVCRAAGNRFEADRSFSQAFWAASAGAVFFVILSLSASGPMTRMLGANAEVYGMTHTYLKIILLFSPAFMLDDVMVAMVRNDGAPHLASAAILAGSFANIFGDYILIFPCGLGIRGAVLATGLSPVISLLVLSPHWLRTRNGFHFVKSTDRSADFRRLLSLSSIGFPSFVAEFATGIVIFIFNFLILRLSGNVGVAAYGVVTNLSLVAIYLLTGLAQGMQPLVSESFGKGETVSMHAYRRYALISMIGLSAIIYIALSVWADPVVAVFNSQHGGKLQEMAVMGIRLYFTALPFAGYNLITAMYFSSAERPKPAQIISLSRGLFVIIPMAFLMAHFFGMTGIWLTFPATEGIVALISASLSLRERRTA